jgi:hypothetical protein
MPFNPANTFLADRATVETWAADGDREAAGWLRDYPQASTFGVDDGAIHVWFRDRG